MAEKEFTNITDLLKQTAETVQQKQEAKAAEEETQINDIFTDFDFDESQTSEDDFVLEDVIPFEEAVLLQKKKQEVPRWIIVTGLTLATVIMIVIGYIYGIRPLFFNLYFKSAIEALKKDNIPQVNRALAKVLFFNPDQEKIYTAFALECWKMGKFKEAANYLEIVKQIKPYYFPMLNLYAKVNISLGDYEAARAYCEQMDRLNGVTAESLYNRGEIYLLKNDLHNAVEAFERSKMYNPEDPAAYLKLRRLYLQLNEFEKALKVQSQLQSLKNAPPLDAEAYAAYGQIFIAKKDYVRAERFYLKSIEENPNQPELYLQLARIYKLQNRIDKVMQNYEKYLELRPNDAYILSDLGYMFYKKRDIKNATLRLQKSLELAPHIPETHYYIAKLYAYIFKNYDFAINEYLKSQELGLNNNEINFHLAYSFYYSDEYKKALDKLLEFYNGDLSNIQLDTSIVDYNLANMYIFNNRYNEAVNKYNAVLASKEWDDKEKIILYNNIGLGYELANNSDSAISYYWKAIELKEHNLDKNNQDFLIGVSLKPKKNFNRILSNNPNITNLKDYLEWDLKNIEN